MEKIFAIEISLFIVIQELSLFDHTEFSMTVNTLLKSPQTT